MITKYNGTSQPKIGARGFSAGGGSAFGGEPLPQFSTARLKPIGARGFEPPISRSRTVRSTKLSYAPHTINSSMYLRLF